ncbi:MAG: TrkH family potassium uptake protein [Planctomycetota bacterium]
MNPRVVLCVLGQILSPFSLLLLAPAAVDLMDGEAGHAFEFALTALGAFGVGMALLWLGGGKKQQVGRTDALAAVAGAWLAAAVLGAFPYLAQGLTPIDALFETMSGFTTTGATIFQESHWHGLSRGLIFWRSMTQWLGGMGIIVLFVAVLPALAVAGRQMFFAEAPGPEEEALTPRIRHTAGALWRVYMILTLFEVALLMTVADLPLFDAVCNSFTTLAAGGFSPHARSIEGYGATAQWVILPFMFLAGASFSLQYRAFRRPRLLLRDTEFRYYFGITVFAGLLLALLLAGTPGHDFEGSLRHGFFQASSIVTTTGYASEDFGLWSQSALMVLFALMFIGGCAGSAGGGPKVVRVILLFRFLAREALIAVHPRAVSTVKLGGRSIPRDTMGQIIGFLLAYLSFFAVSAVAIGIFENDMLVGLSGSIVTLGNIGPGFGMIGPMGTFGDLGTLSKVVLLINMWVGRLEVMTVLVLFHPDVTRGMFRRRR